MAQSRILLGVALVSALGLQAGCGVLGSRKDRDPVNTPSAEEILDEKRAERYNSSSDSTIWDLFKSRDDQGQIGAVNKYIWNAALETLEFLPVQSVDPFTGRSPRALAPLRGEGEPIARRFLSPTRRSTPDL
mgnify:CR=1 FL=1